MKCFFKMFTLRNDSSFFFFRCFSKRNNKTIIHQLVQFPQKFSTNLMSYIFFRRKVLSFFFVVNITISLLISTCKYRKYNLSKLKKTVKLHALFTQVQTFSKEKRVCCVFVGVSTCMCVYSQTWGNGEGGGPGREF